MKAAKRIVPVLLILVLAALPAASQLPRASDGHPDLNGIWQTLNEANYDIERHMARPAMALREGPRVTTLRTRLMLSPPQVIRAFQTQAPFVADEAA